MTDLKAIWQANEHKSYPRLEQNIQCDVLVIGGGIAGVMSAFVLCERGHDVVLLEADKLLSAVTHSTTATITSQHGLIYKSLVSKYGLRGGKNFFNAQEEGIALYQDLIDKYKIDCDFVKLDGYLYATKDATALKEEYDCLLKMGVDAEYVENLPQLPLKIVGAIKQKNQAQFDQIKFLSALPINYRVFESSRVIDFNLKCGTAITAQGQVKANKIVVATNYPIINIPGFTFTKQYQSMTYAAAYSNAGDINGIYNDDAEDGFTLRNYREYLIVNGVDHRAGREPSTSAFEEMDNMAKRLFPECKKEYSWMNEDSTTYDDVPLVGALQKGNNNTFIITGFNKWGMANAIISAHIIADLIDNIPNKYSGIYSPHRKYIMHNLLNMAKGGVITLGGLAQSFFAVPLKSVDKLPKDSGGIYLLGGKKCAVYRDRQDKLFIISAHCPHLGCRLCFNKEAKSWDCICHGTRLNVDGKIIAAPTTKSLPTVFPATATATAAEPTTITVQTSLTSAEQAQAIAPATKSNKPR